MDNTNDPVGVLISALEKLAAQDSGIVASSAKSDCMAATAKAALRNYKAAAIQHSEQRETVPAGAVAEVWENFSDEMDIKWIGPIPPAGTKLYAAPVAAPVPEAKAEQNSASNNSSMSGVEAKDEQVYQWLVRVSKCGMQNIEMSARDLMDYYEGAEPETAPAVSPSLHSVKHEASELPPTWQARTVLRRNQPLTKAGMSEVMSAMEGEIKDLRASQSAPPIAVQGSEDARTLERWWLKADGISDTFVRLSDVEKLLDSRSPVAAAPEDVRKAALEEAIQACQDAIDKHGIHSNFICINAIRALSAAAPSADAKGG